MLDYLLTQDEAKCCGCGACTEACPKGALYLTSNGEGFLYPFLEEKRCIGCRLCERVCPQMSPPKRVEPLEIYALQCKDREKLLESSSGGAFRLLADCVIRRGGVVVGCVWNGKMQPVLTIADSLEGLRPMQGSKYLYSSTKHTYSQVRTLLDAGRLVLFTGTPCQCAGLLSFLRKPYENLLTMDFLCHGVPSQRAFDSYREHCEKQHGGEMSQYKCRDKSAHGWAISESYCVGKRKYRAHGLTSPYLFGYLKGYFNRYSCYDCNFRGLRRSTDYTVCDFWGYRQALDSRAGVSAFQVNTQKGRAFMTQFAENARMHATRREKVAVENPSILNLHRETVPELRKTIYRQLAREGWAAVERKYLRCRRFHLKKLWYALPDKWTKAIKKIVKG